MNDDEWRSLELLVKKIESILAPNGAIIKSPDFLIDKIGNETREVDVSIRFIVGSTPILILIECRNRNKVQDVRWIEEIVTKHKDLGASKSIAVSKNAFSALAIEKAKFYSIELRTFEEVTSDLIKSWNEGLFIELHSVKYQLLTMTHFFKGEYKEIKVNINMDEWNIDSFLPIVCNIDGKDCRAIDLIDGFNVKNLINEMPDKSENKIEFLFNPGKAFANTNYGNIELSSIVMKLVIFKEKELLKTSDLVKYKNIVTGDSHNVAHYDISKYNDGNLTMSAYSLEAG